MIIQEMDMPIIGGGGITMEDIFDIQMTGCHGISVESAINDSFDKKESVEEIKLHLPDAEFDTPENLDSSEDLDELNYQ